MRNSLQQIIRTNQPVNVAACGYQKLTVTGASAQALTVPDGTRYAFLAVESVTTTGTIMRYLNLGATTLPTTTDGLPLEHGTKFDLSTSDDINNFRVIATSLTHTLHVEYYK